MSDEHLNRRIDNLETGEVRIWKRLDEFQAALQRIELNTAGVPSVIEEMKKHCDRIDALETVETERRASWKVIAAAATTFGIVGGAVVSAASAILEFLRK